MSRPKPIVGQTLYALNVGNNARNREQTLTPVVVLSVGRKYFKAVAEECKDRPRLAIQYDLSDWRECTRYTPNWKLYEGAQAWADEQEARALDAAIGQRFSAHRSGLSLAALRSIHGVILRESPPQPKG